MSLRPILMLPFLAALLSSQAKPAKTADRQLRAEALEPRQMLSAAGLVDVGAQPDGALDGKIAYLHAGHGITATGSGWGYQRPLLLDMVEDLGNQDQMTFLADYLWNAGATVVPLRPVGFQANEAVLDNDDAGVTFDGAWGNGAGSVYFGDSGDVRYRFANTSLTETAVATYRPDLPESGFYPVYAWSPAGSNRATDQLYRVRHSGGATEVTVDHSRVGNGLVYLGTYHFDEGTAGAVEISNRSSEAGKVVVADMIRFGNGMGDINRGNGVSGEPRENEAALYWVEWHVDRSQGIPTSAYRINSDDRDATVSVAPRYATYMNQQSIGTLSDRVFVSFHSNASTGNPATASARGVLGLHNTNSGGATPNQLLLAETLARQVNDDLVAQNGDFEHNWANRSNVLFQASFNYGEISNFRINNEFDATIIETGFHDNTQDAQMLRDQRVRDSIARSTYHGIVDYFNVVDNGATQNIDAPPRIAALSAETLAPGQVTLQWQAGTASGFAGGAANGYVVYASTDGLGFDGGTFVAGGGTTTHTLTGLTAGETYFFRVAAVNAGGEAPDSEVVAAKPSASPESVLIVNGFDRLDRAATPKEGFRGGPSTTDRVRVRGGNTYDYAIQVASAINDAGATPTISTASNEAIADGSVSLGDYDAVVWIGGEESSADDSFNPAEQSAVAAYLASGGKLFVSGAEIAWDLDNLNNGRSFFNNSLRADYAADDAGTYNAAGVAGSIFEGLNLVFDDGSEVYDVAFPDVITPANGSTAALSYAAGAGTAGVQFTEAGTGEQVVMLGFPFEALVGDDNQAAVMARVLDYFGFATSPVQNASVILDNDDGAPTYAETGSGWFTSGDPGVDGGTQRINLIGGQATATWTGTLPFAGDAEVFVQYDAGGNRASGVRYEVTVGGVTNTVVVNQQQNDFAWVSLGQFPDAAGSVTVTLDVESSTGAPFSLTIADQVRLDVRGQADNPGGDFNRDGIVNAADYTVWRDTFDQIVTPLSGADADGSGLVDAADLAIWRATYGQVTASIPALATARVVAPNAGSGENPVSDATMRQAAPLRSSAPRTATLSRVSLASSSSSAHIRDEALMLLFPSDTGDRGSNRGDLRTDLEIDSQASSLESPIDQDASDSNEGLVDARFGDRIAHSSSH